MTLDAARAVADAVLYEGYLLYPYRASAAKNQVRWQFGIVGPPGAAEAGVGEEPTMRAECLLELDDAETAALDVHVRFLQVQLREVERAVADGFQPVDQLTVGPATWIRWHEAVERDVAYEAIPLLTAAETEPEATEVSFPVYVPSGADIELLRDADGQRVVGRLVRTRAALTGRLRVSCRPAGGGRLVAVSVELENFTESRSDPGGPDTPRDVAAMASFVGTHLLFAATGARFLSKTDPPDWAAEAAAHCVSHRCWPVLVGAAGSGDVVLASPIILADYPEVAPESPGDLYDSTEIDEILTLRIMTMTDEEKRDARGTDPRAAAIIDRSDSLPPEIFERLHGALRDLSTPARASEPDHHAIPTYGTAAWWNPSVDAAVSPELDTVRIGGVELGKGARVRLHPNGRADAQDLFIDGLTAVVAGVYFDVEGETHVAVVVEDDPAAELHEWYGRYSYFRPDELEPLAGPADDRMPARPQSGRVLVAGVGNIFCRDDGYGCEAARRLQAADLPESVRVVDFGIRGMHLAYELLDGYDALVILDATPRDGAPGDIVVLEVGPDDLGTGELDAHGMAPTAMLASLGSLGGQLPRTFVVGCEPADVSDGMGLTPVVSAAVDRTLDVVRRLLRDELGLTDRADPAAASGVAQRQP